MCEVPWEAWIEAKNRNLLAKEDNNNKNQKRETIQPRIIDDYNFPWLPQITISLSGKTKKMKN